MCDTVLGIEEGESHRSGLIKIFRKTTGGGRLTVISFCRSGSSGRALGKDVEGGKQEMYLWKEPLV